MNDSLINKYQSNNPNFSAKNIYKSKSILYKIVIICGDVNVGKTSVLSQ